jgi:hypothetical protein
VKKERREQQPNANVYPLSVADFQHPATLDLIEDGGMRARIEVNIAAQVEAVGDVVGVA